MHGNEATPLLSQRRESRSVRWLVLFLICLCSLGSSYCYDNPAALQDVMLSNLHISSYVFTSFYSWYSWPNVVLCIFGGLFVDKVGRRLSVCVFCSFVLLGQLVFATGAYFGCIWLMMLGRMFFGIGGESLGSALTIFITAWFIGYEVNFAFTFLFSFSRLGSSVNMYLTRPVYDFFSCFNNGEQLSETLFSASILCVLSVLAAFTLALVDKKYMADSEHVDSEATHFDFSKVLRFPLMFWLITFVFVSYSISVVPFVAIGIKFFQSRFGVSRRIASALNSMIFLFSAVFGPVLGLMTDKYGKDMYLIIFAISGTVFSRGLMTFTFVNPFISMLLFAFSNSLISLLYPMIPLIISRDSVGTAIGLFLSIQNLGLALTNLFSGMVIDWKGLYYLQLFFLSTLLICFFFGLWLFHCDAQGAKILNLPAVDKARMKEEWASNSSLEEPA